MLWTCFQIEDDPFEVEEEEADEEEGDEEEVDAEEDEEAETPGDDSTAEDDQTKVRTWSEIQLVLNHWQFVYTGTASIVSHNIQNDSVGFTI